MDGSQVGDIPSESELELAQRSKEALGEAGLETSSNDDLEDEGPEEDEQGSPQGTSGHQRTLHGGRAETGPYSAVPFGTVR